MKAADSLRRREGEMVGALLIANSKIDTRASPFVAVR